MLIQTCCTSYALVGLVCVPCFTWSCATKKVTIGYFLSSAHRFTETLSNPGVTLTWHPFLIDWKGCLRLRSTGNRFKTLPSTLTWSLTNEHNTNMDHHLLPSYLNSSQTYMKQSRIIYEPKRDPLQSWRVACGKAEHIKKLLALCSSLHKGKGFSSKGFDNTAGFPFKRLQAGQPKGSLKKTFLWNSPEQLRRWGPWSSLFDLIIFATTVGITRH